MLSAGGRCFVLYIYLTILYVLNEAQSNSGFFFLSIINLGRDKLNWINVLLMNEIPT